MGAGAGGTGRDGEKRRTDKIAIKNRYLGVLCFALFLILPTSFAFSGGRADSSAPKVDSATVNTTPTTTSRNASDPLFTGDGGKDLVIAVLPPTMRNGTVGDQWISHFFQDILTDGLATFSAATVLDKTNEGLIKAEQKLSETGFYSDENALEIGNLLNSHYLVVGNIQKASGNYTVTLRVNDAETNAIKTSFSGRYSAENIENGLAPKDAVKELLAGLGVTLTAEGMRRLMENPENRMRATAQINKGIVAEKNDNLVEAMAFFSTAIILNPDQTVATSHIQNFFISVPTGNIQERAAYADAQVAKWKKIFDDLERYVKGNLVIAIYDLSTIQDTYNTSTKQVKLKVTPGVKIVPNRTTLWVWKTVLDNFSRIRVIPENKGWASDMNLNSKYRDAQSVFQYAGGTHFFFKIDLYDVYGDRIAQIRELSFQYRPTYNADFQVIAQFKYFDDLKYAWKPVEFTVPIGKITDAITPRIEGFYTGSSYYTESDGWKPTSLPWCLKTLDEWQELLLLQRAAL